MAIMWVMQPSVHKVIDVITVRMMRLGAGGHGFAHLFLGLVWSSFAMPLTVLRTCV
jgi:hypothetical protein